MACIRVRGPLGERLLAEGEDGNIRGKLESETIVGVEWMCGPKQQNDSAYNSSQVFTSEGILVGNAIRKVTSALGIKHCFKCSGRQARLNRQGLELQRKVKEFFS